MICQGRQEQERVGGRLRPVGRGLARSCLFNLLGGSGEGEEDDISRIFPDSAQKATMYSY